MNEIKLRQKGCLILLFLFMLFGFTSQCSAKTFYVRMYSSTTGKMIYHLKAEANSQVLLPVPEKTKYDYHRYNFMGWDPVRGKTNNARYLPGKPVRVTGNLKLYDVNFPVSKDRAQNPVSVPFKYRKVIIIGDSRMNGVRRAIQGSSAANDVTFIIKQSHGFEWFNDVVGKFEGVNSKFKIRIGAASQLYYELNQLSKDSDRRPVAVVIAYGVQQTRDISGTISEIARPVASSVDFTASVLGQLAKDLSRQNVDLYFVTVGPGNGALSSYLSQEAVYRFNMQIKKRIPDYTVIDLWHRMYKAGFCYGSHKDGVHYSEKTSSRMFNILMSYLK